MKSTPSTRQHPDAASGPDDFDSAGLLAHCFRHHAGRMTAILVRSFGLARLEMVEDVVQDALLAALRSWPYQGIPEQPEAWLMRTARNRAVDLLRREGRWRDKAGQLEAWLETDAADDSWPAMAFRQELADQQLSLLFACCLPTLPQSARLVLTLQAVAAFNCREIGAALLLKPNTVAQRLARARAQLRAGPELPAIPPPEQLPERLESVLAVIYLIFNEGFLASEGEQALREDLCGEALRLVRLLAAHPLGDRPEVHALAALMCLQAARFPARRLPGGGLVDLADQDRSRWDQALLREGFWSLQRSARGDSLSPYHLQAEIAACHAGATNLRDTDWPRIVACYNTLLELEDSPVIRLNRAVAQLQMGELQMVDDELSRLEDAGALAEYAPFHVVVSELARRRGQAAQARAALQRACTLTRNEALREHLERRQALLD